MFKKIRIIALLLILASVSSTLLLQNNVARDWQGSLDIRIIPIITDNKKQTEVYVNSLTDRDFNDIERYLITQAKRYNVDLKNSLNIKLEAPINHAPPVVPNSRDGRLSIMWWSLKLRWWAWRNQLDDHHLAQIRLYVLYQSPEENTSLPHSTGLQNGLIGLINARTMSKYRSINQVIIIHELLHIFGANDKYQLSNGQPVYPDGYANPNQSPLFPQKKAEIMARAIPLSENNSKVVKHLNNIIIGEVTAKQVGWLNVNN